MPATAHCGETGSADSATAVPAIEGSLPVMDANPTGSDDELGSVIVVLGLMTDLLSPEVVSPQPKQ